MLVRSIASDVTGVGHNLTAKPNPLALMEGEEDLEKIGHMVWCGFEAQGFLRLHFILFSACVGRILVPPPHTPTLSFLSLRGKDFCASTLLQFLACVGRPTREGGWCSTEEDALPREMWQGGMSTVGAWVCNVPRRLVQCLVSVCLELRLWGSVGRGRLIFITVSAH